MKVHTLPAKGLKLAVLIAAAMISSSYASAQSTIYFFVGTPFNVFQPIPVYNNGVLVDPGIAPTCPPTCRIEGVITVAQPLPPNFSQDVDGDESLTVQSFTFTNGLATVTDKDATYWWFTANTDANGNIVKWFVNIESEALGIELYYDGVHGPDDTSANWTTAYFTSCPFSDVSGCGYAWFNSPTPGPPAGGWCAGQAKFQPDSKHPNWMVAQFTTLGTLQDALKSCGIMAFDWQQLVTNLHPDSLNLIPNNPELLPKANLNPFNHLTAPPPFYDPPAGGYAGNAYIGDNTYPFYEQSNIEAAEQQAPSGECIYSDDSVCVLTMVSADDQTIWFIDTPQRDDLPGVPPAYANTTNSIGFITSLVAVYKDVSPTSPTPLFPAGTPSSSLFSWAWLTTYNGKNGGVDEKLASQGAADTDDGTGGVLITSINGTSLPPALAPSQVSTTASGLAYSRVSQTFDGTVTITNIGATTINGPLQIVFFGLTANVTLANATADLSGTQYLTVPNVTSFVPGQSVTVDVRFKNPSNAAINFTPTIYSGRIN